MLSSLRCKLMNKMTKPSKALKICKIHANYMQKNVLKICIIYEKHATYAKYAKCVYEGQIEGNLIR